MGDAEVCEQESDGFGGHGTASVGVEGELAGLNVLLATGFLDESLGQRGAGLAQGGAKGRKRRWPKRKDHNMTSKSKFRKLTKSLKAIGAKRLQEKYT